jgi:hypothetical protein
MSTMAGAAPSAELIRLRERLAEAEETIRHLRDLGKQEEGAAEAFFSGLRLTKREAVMVAALMQSRIVTRLDMWRILQRTSRKQEICPEAVSILVHRVRKRLKPMGIEVRNEFGRGYFITDDDKRTLEKLA